MSRADEGVVLDHVAVAVERWSDAWPRYVGELGGTWHSGGVNVGFSPAQLRFANGARVEVLQPWEPEHNPFLRRFLDHSGPGPHHLTFKVRDIEAALRRAGDAGFEPVGVELGDPHWQEAFLHPRQATGVVVQIAQADHEWRSPAPEGFPASGRRPASLRHVAHAVADLGTALGLFGELLGGTVTGRAVDVGGWEWVDLSWGGPLDLRLLSPAGGGGSASALGSWLGDRPGRVHHLTFAWPAPASTGSTAPVPGGPPTAEETVGVSSTAAVLRVVAASENLGTTLVLENP